MAALLNATAIECFKTGATSFALSSSMETTLFYMSQSAAMTPLRDISFSKICFTESESEEPKGGIIAPLKWLTGAKKITNKDELVKVIYSSAIAAAIYVPATYFSQNLMTEMGYEDAETVNQSLEAPCSSRDSVGRWNGTRKSPSWVSI